MAQVMSMVGTMLMVTLLPGVGYLVGLNRSFHEQLLFSVCLWELLRAVDACDSRGAGRRGHLNRVLHLGLHLQILNLLHDHVREAKLDNLLILSNCSYLEIVVVAGEKILSGLPAQSFEVVFECIIIDVSPLFVDVLLVEVVFFGRNERSLQFPFLKILPREVSQPRMILNFISPVGSKTVLRLPLYHL